MIRTINRRTILGGSAATLGAAVAAPHVARAETRRWSMVTSWQQDLPGPGVTARRLAERITTLSGGRIEIQLYAAGELVSGLEVFDAVAGDVAEMGHTASFYWQGKMEPAVYFTTTPFGLTPLEHIAWVEHGGGQELWDELYADFGVKPFMAGNSGMQMGAWLRRELHSLDDLAGLTIRSTGLGAEVMRRLGITPVLTAPAEIFGALQSGAIDGVEFLGPWSDRALGFHRVAQYYYGPGFLKPNGTGECIISLDAWNALPDDLKILVDEACRSVHLWALSETEWRNAEALAALQDEGVELRRWPDDITTAAREASQDIMAGFAQDTDIGRRIHRSHMEMLGRARVWSDISAQAFLAARNANPQR